LENLLATGIHKAFFSFTIMGLVTLSSPAFIFKFNVLWFFLTGVCEKVALQDGTMGSIVLFAEVTVESKKCAFSISGIKTGELDSIAMSEGLYTESLGKRTEVSRKCLEGSSFGVEMLKFLVFGLVSLDKLLPLAKTELVR